MLSVVIPGHNEAGNLAPLTQAIRAALAVGDVAYEIVWVDDASTDGSWAVLQELGRADPRIRGLRLARNCGQSAALWAGLRAARGEIIATMDADLQNDPADLPGLLAALPGHDCVCGSRRLTRRQGDNWLRRVSSRLANGVRNRITRETVKDSACGYRVFRSHCVAPLKFFHGMHRFLPTLFKIEGFSVIEFPVRHHARHSGAGHYGVLNRLFTTINDLLAVRWMQRRTLRYEITERINLPAAPAPGPPAGRA